MIYTGLTKKALKICFIAHKDQADKSGIPYVTHPLHLAEQMQDEVSTCAALLHDVVEDTDYTLEDLEKAGFPEEIIKRVALLTHNDSVPYMDYVAALKDDPVARRVKLADLEHNSDLSRIDHPTDRDYERIRKYQTAIAFLERRIGEEELKRYQEGK